MSAETLRRAANLMRERAEVATPGPWRTRHGFPTYVSGPSVGVTINDITGDLETVNAEHIASWHPGVALAVADWLDRTAHLYSCNPPDGFPGSESAHALTVARAYLGESA